MAENQRQLVLEAALRRASAVATSQGGLPDAAVGAMADLPAANQADSPVQATAVGAMAILAGNQINTPLEAAPAGVMSNPINSLVPLNSIGGCGQMVYMKAEGMLISAFLPLTSVCSILVSIVKLCSRLRFKSEISSTNNRLI